MNTIDRYIEEEENRLRGEVTQNIIDGAINTLKGAKQSDLNLFGVKKHKDDYGLAGDFGDWANDTIRNIMLINAMTRSSPQLYAAEITHPVAAALAKGVLDTGLYDILENIKASNSGTPRSKLDRGLDMGANVVGAGLDTYEAIDRGVESLANNTRGKAIAKPVLNVVKKLAKRGKNASKFAAAETANKSKENEQFEKEYRFDDY